MPKPSEWKIKTNEEGAPVIDGNKVTYVDQDGKEISVDPPSMYQKIIEMGTENKGHREKVEELTATVAVFDGIEDVTKYRKDADKALKTVKNFNDKDWMEADKVETLKREMSDSYEQKIATQKDAFGVQLGEKDQVISKKDGQIHRLLVSNNFATHPLFGGPKPKTRLAADLAESFFSKHFRLEENPKTAELSLIAYSDPGAFKVPIYSRENPGEIATFKEALFELWDQYPGKDELTIATGSGSGAGGGSGDDEDLDNSDLTSLRKSHAKALETGDVKGAIAIKNKIHAITQANAA